MTNEELKKQIIGILLPIIKSSKISCNEENACERCWFPCEINRETDKLADALISAGLRFGENLTATFDHMALEREHELERRLAEAEHRAEVLERALQGACCYIDALGEGCGCCAFIKDDLKCRENCDFLAGLTTFWRNKAEEELKVEKGK